MSMSKEYRICNRCVMDTSDPLITFNELGFCNLCTDFLENRKDVIKLSGPDNSNLEDLVKNIKRYSRGKYHCVMGLSGGVDSSYTAVLAKELGLNILAVHMDNGWNSKISVKNINTLVKKLNIDYQSYVLPWNEFRKVQLAFLEASIPEAETPTDIAITKAINFYARKSNTKVILSGGNISSEGILPMSWHYNSRDTIYSHDILKKFNTPKKYFNSQRFGFFEESYCRFIKRIKTYYPLNYIDYDKSKAREILENDYGWEFYGTKHGESRYTKFIQKFYMVYKHGIDYRRATLSSEICLGRISRSEALKELSQPAFQDGEFDDEIIFIAKKLNIDKSKLIEIINYEPKWFWNYRNNMKFLHSFYDLYRWMNNTPKTSNH